MQQMKRRPKDPQRPSLLLPHVDRPSRDHFDVSSPGPGRTVQSSAEVWAGPIREAVQIVRLGLRHHVVRDSVEPLLAPPDLEVDLATGTREPLEVRASSAFVAVWLLARATGSIEARAGFGEAMGWFGGPGSSLNGVDREAEGRAMRVLTELPLNQDFAEMLPYILDPHPPGTRRAVLRDAHRYSEARNARKANGVFYTPGDVADHMVKAIINPAKLEHLPRVLDPACGSGVFLRSALRQLTSSGLPVHQAARNLYGVDVSLASVESCAFVLMFECLRIGGWAVTQPLNMWRFLRLNLACADSLDLGGRSAILTPPLNEVRSRHRNELAESLLTPSTSLRMVAAESSDLNDFGFGTQRLFPEVEGGFDCVIANPPYARLGRRRDMKSLSERYLSLADSVTPATNSFIPFVELMWDSTNDSGSAAMVVPLSIAYSTVRPAEQLREAIRRSGGDWRFAFFDRTPDALFGDDVKQRVAIISRSGSGPFTAACTPLHRWTSRTRSRLFSSLEFTQLPAGSIVDLIPKLGGEIQAQAYRLLRERTDALSALWLRANRVSTGVGEDSGECVLVAGTAYNWLSVYRSMNALRRGVESPSASPVLRLEFADERRASLAYAILNSRLTYWLWRVEADAFHVPSGFVKSVPFDQDSFTSEAREELASLGDCLWEEVLRRPVISKNGGSETVSYCPHGSDALLDAIDRHLIEAAKLPRDFGAELSRFVVETVVVDPTDATRNGKRNRPLAAWFGDEHVAR